MDIDVEPTLNLTKCERTTLTIDIPVFWILILLNSSLDNVLDERKKDMLGIVFHAQRDYASPRVIEQ